MEIVVLFAVLNLDDDQFAAVKLNKYVHSVVLVVFRFLVAFAVEDLFDFYFYSQQLGKEAFEDTEVCFVAKDFFHRPIEPNMIFCHIINFF